MPQVDAHALCNVHLLRNLQEIVEQEEEPHEWAARGVRMVTGGPVYPRRRPRLAEAWYAILTPALDRYARLPPSPKGRRRGHAQAACHAECHDAGPGSVATAPCFNRRC